MTIKKQFIEIKRNNVTPAQFLAYARAQLKKKGLSIFAWDFDLYRFARGNDLNFDCPADTENHPYATKSVSHPYEMQTYLKCADGCCHHEICEFTFDDEKTGHGYYYLFDTMPNGILA